MTYASTPDNQIPAWNEILIKHIGERTDGFFVEVGAFDGIQWSPSRTLALAGWGGIFFEPQLGEYFRLRANYIDRPDIACIRKAISNFVGKATLFLGGSISTIREDSKNLYMDIPEFQSTGLGNGLTEEVDVSTLDNELEALSAPTGFEVLVIDVEGSEQDVLDGFSIEKWKPRLVVIETHEHFPDERLSAKAKQIDKYMIEAGYRKIGSDHINSIYVLTGQQSEGISDENDTIQTR